MVNTPPTYSNKHLLIDAIVGTLVSKEASHQEGVLKALIRENAELGGSYHGFMFQGKFQTLLSRNKHNRAIKKAPEPSMYPAITAYMAEQKYINQETQAIKQGISLLLWPCKTDQDCRDALPEDIVRLMPTMRMLTRERPEAWSIEDKPLHKFQYESTKIKILYFLTTEMSY